MSLRPWGRHLNFMMDGGRASTITSGQRPQPTSAWLAAVAKAALEQRNLHPPRRRRRHRRPHHLRLRLRQWPPGAARATRARMVASVWKRMVPSIAVSARQASRATTAKTTRAQVRMIRSRTTRPTIHATHVPTTCLTGMRFRATTGWLAAWFSALTAAASRRQPPAQEHHHHHHHHHHHQWNQHQHQHQHQHLHQRLDRVDTWRCWQATAHAQARRLTQTAAWILLSQNRTICLTRSQLRRLRRPLDLRHHRRRRHIDPPRRRPHHLRLRQWPPGAARATRARMVASVWKRMVPSIAVSARQASRATTAKTTRAQVRMIRSRTTRPTIHATHVPTTCLTGMRFRATTGWLAAWFSALTAAASRRQPPAQEHHHHHHHHHHHQWNQHQHQHQHQHLHQRLDRVDTWRCWQATAHAQARRLTQTAAWILLSQNRTWMPQRQPGQPVPGLATALLRCHVSPSRQR